MATKIGVDSLYYALMTEEDTVLAAPTYATPVPAPGVMSLNINPNGAQETLFADNGPMDVASTLGKIELEIKKNELTTADKAALLGHGVDTAKCLVYGADDVPPYVAIGFRSLKSNGNYKYSWLLKGKFMEPEDANETKGDSISFQADTIKGQFSRLNFAYTVASKVTKPWKIDADQDDAGILPAVFTGWFTTVQLPT